MSPLCPMSFFSFTENLLFSIITVSLPHMDSSTSSNQTSLPVNPLRSCHQSDNDLPVAKPNSYLFPYQSWPLKNIWQSWPLLPLQNSFVFHDTVISIFLSYWFLLLRVLFSFPSSKLEVPLRYGIGHLLFFIYILSIGGLIQPCQCQWPFDCLPLALSILQNSRLKDLIVHWTFPYKLKLLLKLHVGQADLLVPSQEACLSCYISINTITTHSIIQVKNPGETYNPLYKFCRICVLKNPGSDFFILSLPLSFQIKTPLSLACNSLLVGPPASATGLSTIHAPHSIQRDFYKVQIGWLCQFFI